MDPYKIIRPTSTIGGRHGRTVMSTQDAGTRAPLHTHRVFLYRNGSGATNLALGHYHRVEGGKILPSDLDGHTHEIRMLTTGAGW